MIGAVIMIYIACWVYQAVVRNKRGNVVRWTIAALVLFLTLQTSLVVINGVFMVADDDTLIASKSLISRLWSTYYELMPSIVAFLVIAVLRTLFILKAKLSMANLFSDMNIFSSSDDESSVGDAAQDKQSEGSDTDN